uniref:Uncharacterized protein LOC100176103 n=1 Tax=Phallusia mammillata TaxID=59560 RepID=A0A6F9DFN7_9ASCI|nr:uncharacterized protein LOC100176103 [Phallusia mammillata]
MEMDQHSKITQDVIEALFRYDLLEKNEEISSPDKFVAVDSLWQLFLATEEKLEAMKISHTKEMNEVQQYVDHVRSLSEERDKLTNEFEHENENLKQQIKEIQEKNQIEIDEVTDMCKQEGLTELIGSTISEQVAYLLVVRDTVLKKVEVLQDQLQHSNEQYNKVSEQLNSLVSEESELQQRMTGAMSEMGGMASKLTEALQERDQLKQEVTELTAALDGIKTLPSVVEAKADTEAHMRELENQKEYYSNENSRLRDEATQAREQEQCSRLELSVHIEELQEMNKNLKEVNFRLNEQLNSLTSSDTEMGDERRKVVANSQKIIEEMQSALAEDEAKTQEQNLKHEAETQRLRDRISQLEEVKDLDGLVEMRAQLQEAKRQYESQCLETERVRESLTSCERELSLREATGSSWKDQHDTQLRIATDLQDRNAILEAELTKVWNQLKEALDKLNQSERERGLLQLRIKDDEVEAKNGENRKAVDANEEEIARLRRKLQDMEERVLSETSGSDQATRIVQLETKLDFMKQQAEGETNKRRELETRLESSERDLNNTRGGEEEMRNNISELQKRALNAEAQILLVTGEREQHETEKLVAELNRTQLEDAVELLRGRMELYAAQSRNYADRYKNLKSKHKSKIRRIRELFFLERRATAEELEDLERRLASAEDSLSRELAWKEEAASDVQRSEEERRLAIHNTDNALKKVEKNLEKINHLTQVTEDLDAKNNKLQRQLSMLEKQKQELAKVVEATKVEQREELNTLLSSLNMSGSLPYMGRNNQGDFTGNYTSESGIVSFASPIRDEFGSLDLGVGIKDKVGKNGHELRQSSYLNLTDVENSLVLPTKSV